MPTYFSSIIWTLLISIVSAGFALPSFAHGQSLTGVFDTGQSEMETGDNSSLHIRFHPCEYDLQLTCGTIEKIIEGDNSSGEDVLPSGAPILGFRMIENLKDFGDGEFKRGKINAVDETMSKGKMIWYGLRVKNNNDGTLTAKGCLGFVCPRTMVWRAVDEEREAAGE